MKQIISTLLLIMFLHAAYAHYANQSLSNLTTTAVNQNLLPAAANLSVGTSTKPWKFISVSSGLYVNGYKVVSVPNASSNFFGTLSGVSTTGGLNTGVGYKSLFANTSGTGNVAVGANSMGSLTSGKNNIAVGNNTMINTTGGAENIAIGTNALRDQFLPANNNIAVGNAALAYCSEAKDNVILGGFALPNVGGNAYRNVAVGVGALIQAGDAEDNTIIGNSSGTKVDDYTHQEIYDYRKCTSLGANTGFYGVNNATAIGYGAVTVADNSMVFGNTGVQHIGGFTNYVNYVFSVNSQGGNHSEKENVPGLSFIKLLEPVTFKHQTFSHDPHPDTTTYTGFNIGSVLHAAHENQYSFSGISDYTEGGGTVDPTYFNTLYGIRYAEFVVPLTKAAQQLSDEVDTLKKQNEKLEQRIAALETAMQNNETARIKNDESTTVINATGTLLEGNPNPSRGNVRISYSLPANTKNASIIIMQAATGKVVKTISVTAGESNISVSLQAFANGNYQYALIADGNMLASKKLVVIK